MASAPSDHGRRQRRRLLRAIAYPGVSALAGVLAAGRTAAAADAVARPDAQRALASLLSAVLARSDAASTARAPMSAPVFPADLTTHPGARYEHWQWRSIRWRTDEPAVVDAHWQRFDRLAIDDGQAPASAASGAGEPASTTPTAWDAGNVLASQGYHWQHGAATPRRRSHIQRDALGLAASSATPARIHVLDQSLALSPASDGRGPCGHRVDLQPAAGERLHAELAGCPDAFAVRALAGWQAFATLQPSAPGRSTAALQGAMWLTHHWGHGAAPAQAPVVLDTLVLQLPGGPELRIEHSKRRLRPDGPRSVSARWRDPGGTETGVRRIEADWVGVDRWQGDVTGLQYVARARITLPALSMVLEPDVVGTRFESGGADGWHCMLPVTARVVSTNASRRAGSDTGTAYGFLQLHPEST